MTNGTNYGPSKYLADVPLEVAELVAWYSARAARGDAEPKLTDFVAKFLSWMSEDHTLIPTLPVSALGLLALTLGHYQERNPAMLAQGDCGKSAGEETR